MAVDQESRIHHGIGPDRNWRGNGALDRDQQLGLVKDFTALIAKAADDPTLEERTWVSLTEAVPGGWGIAGHAYTNEEIIQHVRKLLGKA